MYRIRYESRTRVIGVGGYPRLETSEDACSASAQSSEDERLVRVRCMVAVVEGRSLENRQLAKLQKNKRGSINEQRLKQTDLRDEAIERARSRSSRNSACQASLTGAIPPGGREMNHTST